MQTDSGRATNKRNRAWAARGFCAAAAFAFLLASAPSSAQRAATGPADWPCVQRLIPELSWSSMWTGPSIDDLETNWWDDDEVGRLVRVASTRSTSEDEAVQRVREFAEQVSEDREYRLTLLFAGLFERVGRERSRAIEAIRRYTRGQVAQLERLGDLIDRLEESRAGEEADRAQVQQLEQELFWERRLFEDRQASLRALCEQPYLMEERLSRLVRAIQSRL